MSNIKTNLCFGCMRPIELNRSRCPLCGYDNAQQNNLKDVLLEETVLNGKYLVGKMLGRGGFGITYLGFDLNLRIRITIREYFPVGMSIRVPCSYDVLPLADRESAAAFEKGFSVFLNEEKNLSIYGCPYIVHVRDVFKEHGTVYIIMDYIEGTALSETVAGMGEKMPVEQVLSLMKPLIQQLAALHCQKIIHRGIMPRNIVIVKEAESGEEKLVLVDFSSACPFNKHY